MLERKENNKQEREEGRKEKLKERSERPGGK